MAIPLYLSIGVMYIVVNYALSKLAHYLQGRIGSRRQRTQMDQTLVAVEAGAGGV
jgi:hypothetical protein